MPKKSNRKKSDIKQKKYQALIIAENIKTPLENNCLTPCPLECPLEKTLQFLEKHSIEEIFIFTSTKKEEIQKYLQKRKKKSKNEIKLLFTENCISFGDILRSVFSMKVMNENFVLINGHTITDANLGEIFENFEKVNLKEKGILMMKIFKERERGVFEENQDFVVFDKKKRIMNFYEKKSFERKTGDFFLKDNYKFQFKKMFKKEFEEENCISFNLRDLEFSICSLDILNCFAENFDFHSEKEHFLKEVLSSEISDAKIGVFIIEPKYFFEVTDSSFNFFRASLKIIKNCFSFFYINSQKYNFSHFNKIISKNSKISITSILENNVFIAENVILEEGVLLENCIILENSKIGKNSKIKNTIITANSIIPQNSTIQNAYLLKTQKTDSIENQNKQKQKKTTEILDNISYCLESDEEAVQIGNNFTQEINETLTKLTENFEDSQGIALEILSLKLAENRTFSDCCKNIFNFVLHNMKIDKNNILSSISYINNFKKVLLSFVKGKEEMMELILTTEEFCKGIEEKIFHLVIQCLYKLEILEDSVVVEWFDRDRGECGERETEFLRVMEKFVEWLREEEEESGEEESETGSESGSGSEDDS